VFEAKVAIAVFKEVDAQTAIGRGNALDYRPPSMIDSARHDFTVVGQLLQLRQGEAAATAHLSRLVCVA